MFFADKVVKVNTQWTQSQLQAFQKVMDAFHTYDNVAGFYIGNEVLTNPAGTPAAPYVKAATRDLKAYRDAKGYRKIPVGYSAADIASSRPMLQNYLACGNASDAVDFFSLNAYEWCGESTFATSGYAQLTSFVKNYSIPIFFSETGCITARPRTFGDMAAIYGPDMNPYWSGSMVYEWIEEANNYGIIQYGPKVDPSSPGAPPDGFPRSGTPQPVQPDFDNLKNQWSAINPTIIKEADYNPSNSAPACPARTAGTWEVDPNAPLPPPPAGASKSTNTSSSGNGTSSSSSAAKASSSGAAGSNAGSSITGTSTSAMATAVTTTAMVAAGVSLGSRSMLPIALLVAVCWSAGAIIPF